MADLRGPRALAVAALLAAVAGVMVWQGLTSPAGIRRAVEGAGVAAPVVFVAVYAAPTVLLVPGAVGSAAAGALFGAAWGSALVIVGATLGAPAAFVLAGSLGRARIERLTGPRIRRVDRWLTDRGLGAVLFLRLAPLGRSRIVDLSRLARAARHAQPRGCARPSPDPRA